MSARSLESLTRSTPTEGEYSSSSGSKTPLEKEFDLVFCLSAIHRRPTSPIQLRNTVQSKLSSHGRSRSSIQNIATDRLGTNPSNLVAIKLPFPGLSGKFLNHRGWIITQSSRADEPPARKPGLFNRGRGLRDRIHYRSLHLTSETSDSLFQSIHIFERKDMSVSISIETKSQNRKTQDELQQYFQSFGIVLSSTYPEFWIECKASEQLKKTWAVISENNQIPPNIIESIQNLPIFLYK